MLNILLCDATVMYNIFYFLLQQCYLLFLIGAGQYPTFDFTPIWWIYRVSKDKKYQPHKKKKKRWKRQGKVRVVQRWLSVRPAPLQPFERSLRGNNRRIPVVADCPPSAQRPLLGRVDGLGTQLRQIRFGLSRVTKSVIDEHWRAVISSQLKPDWSPSLEDKLATSHSDQSQTIYIGALNADLWE